MPRLSRYQSLTVVTVGFTLALIAVGALVRTTGSGLGCPDWPLCHGSLLPPAEKAAIIEYSHRTLASIVGMLIIAVALVSIRVRRDDHVMIILALSSLPLLGLQAWIGKITVERELPAEVVMFHLMTALVLLAIQTLISAFAILGSGRQRIDSVPQSNFQRLSMVAMVVIAIVMLVGAYLVGVDAGFACTDWPACPEALVPFMDGERLQHIHWLHRLTVVGGLVAVALVAMAATTLPDQESWLPRATWILLGLYLLQIFIGALNIWTEFSAVARVLHLAAGSAIWACLVVIVFAGRYRTGAPFGVAKIIGV